MDRSIEAQEAIARELWRRETEQWITEQQPESCDPSELFRHCRQALGLGVYDAAGGPLEGIITPRRLRRVESGQEPDIPPRAWQVYADLLIDDGHVELAQWIAHVCPSVKLSA